MKKYTKPMVEIVELTVKESLSALPELFNKGVGFKATTMGKWGSGLKKNVTVYTYGTSNQVGA